MGSDFCLHDWALIFDFLSIDQINELSGSLRDIDGDGEPVFPLQFQFVHVWNVAEIGTGIDDDLIQAGQMSQPTQTNFVSPRKAAAISRFETFSSFANQTSNMNQKNKRNLQIITARVRNIL